MEICNLPLCICGCGNYVSKMGNRYLVGHYKKKYSQSWNIGIKLSQETKSKMSASATKKFQKKPGLKENCKWKKFTYSRILSHYQFLLEVENCRDFNGELQFTCKKCKEWFSPTPSQIGERVRALKQKCGLINNFLYCSDNCKTECRYYNRHSDPDEFDKFQEYRMLVVRETGISIRKYGHLIKDFNKRSLEYNLDHRYSIYQGFKNNADPKIIGHWRNLQILSKSENIKKGVNCDIVLEQLIDLVNGDF